VAESKPKPFAAALAQAEHGRSQGPDRIEALARELFARTASEAAARGRTVEYLAAEAIRLARAFYAVWDEKQKEQPG
jgi:hypothetical protein